MRFEPVQPRGGLLAVHAHPDDETLATGALLATWAAAGEPVAVVTCTRGEQGEVIGADLAHLEGDGPALASRREGELAAALASLGVRTHFFLDQVPLEGDRATTRYADSGMAWAAPGIARAAAEADLPADAFVAVPLEEAAQRLARVLRTLRPRVVVTYEPSGGYGHPDHVRAHEVTVRAIELATAGAQLPGPDGVAPVGAPGTVGDGERWEGPTLWQSVVPAEVARAARRELAELVGVRDLLAVHPELSLPDPEENLPPVAKTDLDVVEVVETAPVLRAVLDALRAHATQVQHVGAEHRGGDDGTDPRGGDHGVLGWYALSNDVLAALPSREFYSVLSEPAAGPRRFTGERRAEASTVDGMKKTGARTAGRAALCVLLGLLVGTVGTVMHRVVVTDHLLPVGIVVALLAVLAAGTLARAWAGYAGVVGYAIGWVVAVQLLAAKGPGGDLLVPNQTIGLVWVYGGMAVVAITAFLPWSWFSDRPVRRRVPAMRAQIDTGSSPRPPHGQFGADA